MGRQYKHVSLADRVEIEKLLDRGWCQAEIARRLGRSRSTISREVARRSWRPSNTSAAYTPYRPGLRSGEWTKRQYRATIAQAHAERAAARSHQPWVMKSDALVGYVRDRLRRGWTPEEIAGRLPLEFGNDPTMRVSHETLYAWIYAPAQKHVGLWQYLARGLRKRRKRGPARKTRRAPQIPFRVGIEDRPVEIAERCEFGHWEADSVQGGRKTDGGLHSEVERVSRFLAATKIKSITAQATLDAQRALIASLPTHAVKSITADNGSEFAYHHQLADTVGVPTYFATPYSAWQRGTNEHFNGRIRKYLPKRTRLDTITEHELADIITEINNRPRKILDWRTPAEVFNELCSDPATPVALQI